MGARKKKAQSNESIVPVSTEPYPIKTGKELIKEIKSIRRMADNFALVERRREEGSLRT
ncbi:hypothetical protein LLG46_00510 [bacterium]|nr:hypothetical protein [bacterium]